MPLANSLEISFLNATMDKWKGEAEGCIKRIQQVLKFAAGRKTK